MLETLAPSKEESVTGSCGLPQQICFKIILSFRQCI